MKKMIVLDMMAALDEMVENEIIDQFDELNAEVIKKIIAYTKKIANEE